METSACGRHWRQGRERMMGCCQASLMVAECVFQQEQMREAKSRRSRSVKRGMCQRKPRQGAVNQFCHVQVVLATLPASLPWRPRLRLPGVWLSLLLRRRLRICQRRQRHQVVLQLLLVPGCTADAGVQGVPAEKS